MILSFVTKINTEVKEETIFNNYEILKINVEDTYQHMEKMYKHQYNKFKLKSRKLKQIEEEINNMLNTFDSYSSNFQEKAKKGSSTNIKEIKVHQSTKEFGIVNTINKEYLSTCETSRLHLLSSKISSTEKNFFLTKEENIAKWHKLYKSVFSKYLQIKELNKTIIDYYDHEIKILINSKKMFSLEKNNSKNLLTQSNVIPIRKRNIEEEEETGLINIVTCSGSRGKGEENRRKEKEKDCLIF